MGFFDTLASVGEKVKKSAEESIERRRKEVEEIDRKAVQGDPAAIRKQMELIREQGRQIDREMEKLNRS